MARNPFHKTEGAAESEGEPGAGALFAPPEPEPADGSDGEPTKASADAEGGEGAQGATLFGDSKERKSYGKDPAWQRIMGQRDQARETVERLNAELAAERELAGAVRRAYAGKQDPAALLEWDAQFLSAWEELSQTDPEAARVAAKVKARMGQQQGAPAERTPAAAPEKPGRPSAADQKVEKLLRRSALQQTQAVLVREGLTPQFQRLVAAHVVDHAEDLADLDTAAILALSREWITSHDFTEEQLTGRKPGAKAPAARRPPVAATRRAAPAGEPSESDADAGDDENKRQPAKTHEQWRKNRERAFRQWGTATA